MNIPWCRSSLNQLPPRITGYEVGGGRSWKALEKLREIMQIDENFLFDFNSPPDILCWRGWKVCRQLSVFFAKYFSVLFQKETAYPRPEKRNHTNFKIAPQFLSILTMTMCCKEIQFFKTFGELLRKNSMHVRLAAKHAARVAALGAASADREVLTSSTGALLGPPGRPSTDLARPKKLFV